MTRNWPKYLKRVTNAINNSPNSAIGGLKPGSINSTMDSTRIDEKIGFKEDVPVEEQKKNQVKYERQNKKTSIQVGNYVYLDYVPSAFDKSF